jgi:hypothetical protein
MGEAVGVAIDVLTREVHRHDPLRRQLSVEGRTLAGR